MVKLENCGCTFCRECLKQYISFEVMEGANNVSCPDPNCVTQGVLSQNEMESLSDKQLMEKHQKGETRSFLCLAKMVADDGILCLTIFLVL